MPDFPPQPPESAQQQNNYAAQKETKPWYKKWWVWLIIIVVLAGVGKSFGGGEDTSSKASPSAAPTVAETNDPGKQEAEETADQAPEPEPAAEPEWTVVTTISGNADQQSDTITLTGGKVRLTYEFTDPSGYGMIVGGIYVLSEGTDIMVDGGIPDVMISEADAGETILRKAAGDYYVKVTAANAAYTVTIEEEK